MRDIFYPGVLTRGMVRILGPAGLGVLLFGSAIAQGSTDPATVSAPVIEQRIKEVEASQELDEETSKRLQEQYRRALGYLEAAQSSKETAQRFESARQTAPVQAQKEREELARLEAEQGEVSLDLAEDIAASEVEQVLNQEKANRAAVDAKLNDLEQRLKAQATRPTEIRQRLIEARDQTDQIASQLQAAAPASETARDTEARRWLLETQAAAISAEIRALDQELLSQPMRLQLMQVQRDRSARSLRRMDTRVKLLEEFLAKRRLSEAEEAVAAAETASQTAETSHPVAAELAEQNKALGEELTRLTRDLEATANEEIQANAELKRIQDEYRSSQQKLDVAGLSQTLGRALQDIRRDLPDVRLLRKQSAQREKAIANAGLLGLQYEDERRKLRDLNAYVEERLAAVPEAEREPLRQPLTDLATTRRELLERVVDSNDDLVRAMTDLEFVGQQLVTAVGAFDVFLDERLLWVRSADPVKLQSTLLLPREIAEFLGPTHWGRLIAIYWYEIRHSPLLLLSLVVAIFLLVRSPRFAREIRATAGNVRKISTDSYKWTALALGYSLLMTLPWPLLTLSSGWFLFNSLEATDFAKAAGFALMRMTPALFFLRGLRVLSMGGGVAEVHFKWSAPHLKRLRGHIDRFMLMFLIPLFVLMVTLHEEQGLQSAELGKLAFIFILVGLWLFLNGLFRPEKGVFAGLRPQGWTRTGRTWRRLIYLFLTLLPLAMAGLVLAGYLYTAGEIIRRLVMTMWLVFLTIIIHELALRWLLLVRRKLRLQQARERRAAAQAAKENAEADGTIEGSSDEFPTNIDEPEVDLVSLDAQTRKLVNAGLLVFGIAGLWAIWSSVLPALGILNEVTLWSQIETINGEPTAVPVTLATLGKATLIAILTLVAARNLPSLLEIILLQRLDIASGSRLAVSTLARYGIAGFGTVMVLSTIGGSWSQIQWLVAALSVGIGFGLQEIVANFISGIIILLERPVRVGDTVTVGDASGVVTRIQIRATTITNWERQELLVPNKEFITGRVLNWSLSDEVIRLSILVGVAYGSNVERALELMYQVATSHPKILDDPPPFVTFDNFGDNSLNLILRAYVSSIAHRRETASDIHREINRLFNDEGIVIAFPQRDIHLDTLSPLEIRLRNDGQQPAES